jgi:hypothetical protein
MRILSVPAVFDGKAIRLLDDVPYTEPYRVVVTFVEPVGTPTNGEPDLSRFWASFGAWQDDVSVEETIEMIHAGRRSKAEPPEL